MPLKLENVLANLKRNQKGLISVFGAFLLQLCVGSYHGTFGNLLPYLTSYLRKDSDDEVTNGDVAMIMSVGGLAQGVSLLLGGLIIVPTLGARPSLALASLMYSLAPVFTWVTLTHLHTRVRVWVLTCVYGMVSSSAMALVSLVTMTLPVTWFPDHRGKVIGFIASGFGLSSTVLSPLQSLLVNPDNLSPGSQSSNSSVSSYFTDPAVLDNLPPTLLYMSAIYAVISIIGVSVVVGQPEEENKGRKSEQSSLKQRLIAAANYFFSEAAKNTDFYLLWLARFLYLTVGVGVLVHWKTFSFTQSKDDQMVSIAGGVSGVVDFFSRIACGVLFDKLGYRKLMTGTGLLLTINLICIYYIGQNFIGLLFCVWLVYFLGFAHFTTIPAQAHKLFPGQFTYVVLGCVGLAESFSYGALGVLNMAIMADDSNPQMFLIFFLTLAGCSLVSMPVTWCVRESREKSSEDYNANTNNGFVRPE